ncbi:DJ-1/PfpI family protein [Alicyclobacillus curvatus]|nr:DJ-1/PfpI family protein [Alicyclobacillus curvatus]
MKSAAFLALPGCAIWQVASLQALLRAQGWSMRTLTLGGQAVDTDGGLHITPDANLYSTFPRDFKLLLVAGGHVTEGQLHDPGMTRFLRQYDVAGGLVASIGFGTSVIAAAGLIGGLHVAVDDECRQRFGELFEHAIVEKRDVVHDGSVITACAHAASEFANGVMRLLDTYTEIGRNNS